MGKGDIQNIVVLGLGVAAVGAWFYYTGLHAYRLKKVIEYTPTTKTLAAAPGIVELSGVAREVVQHVSPYNGEKCAYYCTKLYRHEKRGKSSSWVLKKKIESPDEIAIEDDTGSALVRPQTDEGGILSNATWKKIMVKKDGYEQGQANPGIFGSLLGQKADTESKLYKFVEKHATNLMNDSHRLRVEETFIKDGDPIYVIGEAKFEEGRLGAAMKVVPDERRKIFCIADGSEKNAMSDLGWSTMLGVFGGPLVVAGGAFIVSAGFVMSYAPSTITWAVAGAGALVVLGMYAYAAAIHLLEMYNGTVTLRMSVEKAKANVDVLLKRRAQLIPNLVEVVRQAGKYEKGLQMAVANMRAGGFENDEKYIFALAEKFPDLQANQNYISLQKQLVKTENWLAASRAYVADSIMLYNTRIAQFPYSLFAGMMKMAPITQDEALR